MIARVRLRWVLTNRAIAIGLDESWYAWSLASLMAGRLADYVTRDSSSLSEAARERAVSLFDARGAA